MHSPSQPDEDLYAVLGVTPTTDAAQLKQAWRRLAARYHPDASPDNPDRNEKFLRIQHAYSVLGNPLARRQYDDSRGLPAAFPPATDFFPGRLSAPHSRGPACLIRSIARIYFAATRGLHQSPRGRVLAEILVGLPWISLVRIRTLAFAVVAGLLVANWHLAVSRHRIVPVPGSAPPSVSPSAGAVPPASPPASEAFPPRGTSAPMPRVALSAHPSRRQVTIPPPPSSPYAVLALPFPASPAPAPSLPLVSSGVRPEETPKTQRLPLNLREEQDRQATESSPPESWRGSWLAGCISPEGKEVWTGHLDLDGATASFGWHSWLHPDRTHSPQFTFRVAPDTESSGTRLFLLPLSESPHPHALLSRPLESFALLVIPRTIAANAPCLEWHLASHRAAALAGRWLLPDHAARDATGPFPLEYLEIQIAPPFPRYTGHLIGQYGLRPSLSFASASAASAILPSIQFAFDASPDGFDGTFHWRNATHGEGTLTVAPIGPSALAIRWQVHRLTPGKLQLTGGSAVLRRH